MALPLKNRIKKQQDIALLFSDTRPLVSDHFSLRARIHQADDDFKISVLVPVKIAAHATARNLLRRRTLGAISRIMQSNTMYSGVSAIITLRKSTIPGADEIVRELLSLMKKSGILHT